MAYKKDEYDLEKFFIPPQYHDMILIFLRAFLYIVTTPIGNIDI